MNSKEYFMLTARTIDRQKTFFATKDYNVKQEAIRNEAAVVEEIIRVAMIDKDIHDMITAECPWLCDKLKKAEAPQEGALFT